MYLTLIALRNYLLEANKIRRKTQNQNKTLTHVEATVFFPMQARQLQEIFHTEKPI